MAMQFYLGLFGLAVRVGAVVSGIACLWIGLWRAGLARSARMTGIATTCCLLEAGQADLETIFCMLEHALSARLKPWPFGAPGVVECAWFPNLVAAKPLGFRLDEARFPTVAAWLTAMRAHPIFMHDGRRTAAFLKEPSSAGYERTKLFWSGDRLEWLLSRGFHDWFMAEIAAGRAIFPPYASAAAD